MIRFVLSILAVTGMALGLFSPNVDAAQSPSIAKERTITVRGEASLSVKPDLAEVNIGVVSREAKADAALEANNQSMKKVLERIKSFGVQDRDVRTSGFQISPRYESGRVIGRDRRIVGYAVQNRVSVRIRDLSQLGGFLSRVVEDGANRLEGIQFSVEETEQRQDQLRAEAVRDVLRKARVMAEAAGVRLGNIIRITEGGLTQPGPRPLFSGRVKAMEAVPVAPGERTLRATVTVVFEIK